MTTLLGFLLTLGVLIVFHEYGHYRVARAFGVRVLRFSVGFGRVLWRRQRDPSATEFVVCAWPLGGYVRMLDEREMPVAPAERHAAFNRKPLPQRAAIVAAGPLANLVLAVALYALAHGIGVDEPRALLGAPHAGSLAEAGGMQSGDLVQAVSRDGVQWQDIASLTDLRWQVSRAIVDGEDLRLLVADREGRHARTVSLALRGLTSREPDAKTWREVGLGGAWRAAVLGRVQAGGPADQAGLREGDRVLRIDGTAVEGTDGLLKVIRAAGAGGTATPMRWTVDRGGRETSLSVTPRVQQDPQLGPVGRIDAFVGAPVEIVTVRLGPWQALVRGAERTWEVATLTVRMLGRMLVGEASVRNLSGPLTIADFAGQTLERGLTDYLAFLALVSVSLGVLNLLPLPMLDGGHLMYYLFEAVTGRPVSDAWLARLQRGGIAVLLALMSVALFNDVARLFGLP